MSGISNPGGGGGTHPVDLAADVTGSLSAASHGIQTLDTLHAASSLTAKGLIQLASAAEAALGTDAFKAITPATLGAVAAGLSGVFDSFTPIDFQTLFTLSSTPNVGFDSVMLFINGTMYSKTTHFTQVGTTITWLDTEFTIASTDRVEAFYFV